jgi:hypothetical protein
MITECRSAEQYLNDTGALPTDYLCEQCPPGGACGSDTAAWSTLNALPGWWKIPESERAGSNVSWKSTAAFHKCFNPDACLGTPTQPFTLDTNETSTCAIDLGFRNGSRLCQACGPGFSQSAHSLCLNCGGGAGSSFLLLLFGGFAMCIGFAVTVGIKLRSFGKPGAFRDTKRANVMHSTLKRIVLSHVQTLSLVMGLAVPWPKLLVDAMAVFSAVLTFSDNANGVECLGSGDLVHADMYYGLLLCCSLLPLFLWGTLALFWLKLVPKASLQKMCSFCCFYRCGDRPITCGINLKHGKLRMPKVPHPLRARAQFVPSFQDLFVASSTLCWYLTLPSLMRVGFGVMQCRAVGKTEYMVVSMDVRCWEGNHMAYAMGAGFPALVLYAVVMPAVIMLRLRRATAKGRLHPTLLLRYGLMFQGYREKKYWWELIVLLRKYTVIASSTLIVSDTTQLQVVLGLLIFALQMHDANNPYGRIMSNHQQLHRFEMVSLLLLTCMVWCGLYFSSLPDVCDSGWCVLLVVLVLVLNFGYVLLLSQTCYSRWCKESKAALRLSKKKAMLVSAAHSRASSLGLQKGVAAAMVRLSGGVEMTDQEDVGVVTMNNIFGDKSSAMVGVSNPLTSFSASGSGNINNTSSSYSSDKDLEGQSSTYHSSSASGRNGRRHEMMATAAGGATGEAESTSRRGER